MTIRDRFEKLQRYGHLDDADTGESWLTVGNEGSWLKRSDVLALADELEREYNQLRGELESLRSDLRGEKVG